eukprot:jgi/Phyca11/537037/estExt2_fgenesh1_pg.C_PHYCAscaffold_720003
MAGGMYTKMTSTGSSLIVNPRTISKELEAKIATAIAGVIATHDVSKLTTKLVRQAVEKEVHVSLSTHKDVLKRLMHQELRKLKAKKVAKRVTVEPWKIVMRRESMVKGLNCVYHMVREAASFPDWGLHAIQSLYDLQAVEEGEVLRLATLYARLIGALWMKQDRHADWAVGTVPTPTQLVNAIKAVYLVERLGISHVRRVELLEFCDRSPPVYGAKVTTTENTKDISSTIGGTKSTSSEVATSSAVTPAETEDAATRVAFLQGLLDQTGNVKSVPAELATHVLTTLAGMVLTVDILKSTGVGRTINKLRKHSTPSVAKAATQLVAKWKKDLL